jgi:putative holliday junction resolvase
VGAGAAPNAHAAAATVMAFDYGMKRVGVAVGEPNLRTAHALSTVAVPAAQLFDAIAVLVDEWKPARFVVGRPSHEDGTAHAMTARCERFSRQLAGRFKRPVTCVDERYSSIDAHSALSQQGVRAKDQRGKSDSLAAAFILERYFESLT